MFGHRVLICLPIFGLAAPAIASDNADDEIIIEPTIDARLRYERVEQDNGVQDADALTLRTRVGVRAKKAAFSFLVEAEANLAMVEDFNSTTNGNNGVFSTVADPENVELNRLQLAYHGIDETVLSVGRQRIILNDSRFVGNVGWRQNEQTYDAVRIQSQLLDPVSIDASYITSQRTIFGVDAGERQSFEMDSVLVDMSVELGQITIGGFAYLIDQDERSRVAFASQTYGLRAAGEYSWGDVSLALRGSYANQTDYTNNPADFSVSFANAEAGFGWRGFQIVGGYELLGSDNGMAAFQTPLATLHKFNGTADVFLVTPDEGLQDYYGGMSAAFGNIGPLQDMRAQATYHVFESDIGSIRYGEELDAQLGFRIETLQFLIKYADYQSDGFGVDTQRFWIQIGWQL